MELSFNEMIVVTFTLSGLIFILIGLLIVVSARTRQNTMSIQQLNSLLTLTTDKNLEIITDAHNRMLAAEENIEYLKLANKSNVELREKLLKVMEEMSARLPPLS